MSEADSNRQKPFGSRFYLLAFVALLLLGAILRLVLLGKAELWIDEITILGFGGVQYTPGQIIERINGDMFKGGTGQHMHFQYVWLNMFLHLYQDMGIEPGHALIRLPFTLLGILSLPLFYLPVREHFGRQAGIWTMALGAIAFFHVYQSRDATGYGPFLFFVALNLYGLSGMVRYRTGVSGRRIWRSLLFTLGTVGMLVSHLTAWMLLLTEGLLLLLRAILIVSRRKEEDTSNYFAAAYYLLPPMIIIGLCCLPFVSFLFAAASGSGGVEGGGPVDRLSLPLLLYQFAHFGFGRGAGRLIFFCICMGLGMYGCLRDRETRNAGLFLLGMILLPSAMVFMVLKRDFAPRYVAAAYLPLLAVAGIGMRVLVSDAAKKLKRPAQIGLIVAVGALLIAWAIGPYRAMFSMTDKLMPMSRVRDTVMRLVPPGGLYVWRNGYHRREVPGTLPTPERFAVYADLPNAGIPEQVRQQRSQNGRSFFVRFPEAILLADMKYSDPLWQWIHTDFVRHEIIEDTSMDRLWKWGFSPHGHRTKEMKKFVAYYNPVEDLEEKLRNTRTAGLWPTGSGWQYIQVQDERVFVTPRGPCALRVMNQAGAGMYQARLQTVAVAPGGLRAHLQTPEGSREIMSRRVAQQGPANMGSEAFWLEEGESTITISQTPEDQPVMLVFAFSLVPAGDKPEGQGTKE